jgi:hypothetical protein
MYIFNDTVKVEMRNVNDLNTEGHLSEIGLTPVFEQPTFLPYGCYNLIFIS